MIKEQLIALLNRKETLLDDEGNPYLIRYIIWGKKNAVEQKYHGIGLYVQKLIKSDTSNDLYDHPWRWGRFVLKGQFNEVFRNRNSEITRSRKVRMLHSELVLSSRFSHSITLIDEKPVWMILWHGRYRNQWGFWINNKKIHWREHFGLNVKSTT